MKLIIGLGNPGGKFAKTRHNVGHLFISNIKNQISKLQSKKLKAKGEKRDRVRFVKTSAFMNDSGSEVRKLLAINNQQLTINNLLIIHDDMDLPLGKFKLQKGKGAAGHKGVQSVIDALGTRDFWRLRFGIGRPPAGESLRSLPAGKAGKTTPRNTSEVSADSTSEVGESAGENFVLSKFSQDELERIQKVFEEAYPRVLEWSSDGEISEGK